MQQGASLQHGASAQHICLIVSPRQLHHESINWLLFLLSSVAIEPRRSRGACRSMPIDALNSSICADVLQYPLDCVFMLLGIMLCCSVSLPCLVTFCFTARARACVRACVRVCVCCDVCNLFSLHVSLSRFVVDSLHNAFHCIARCSPNTEP